MRKNKFEIDTIPAILWGEKSEKLFIVVHGNMSNKEDDIVVVFADEVTKLGYEVLSFDLPQHGDCKGNEYICNVQNCIRDLKIVMDYAKSISKDISLFACGMGAYFSLLEYKDEELKQSLFLSPVVDMKRIIENMMSWFNINEEELKQKGEISTTIGQSLYWDYYCYVRENPITKWDSKTSILYGAKDDLCELNIISKFTKNFNCNLEIMEGGEHYFHTKEQLDYLRTWTKEHIYNQNILDRNKITLRKENKNDL